MRWGHATRLPKPPYADSRRHSGVNASILARAPRGNRPPEWSTILAQGLLRPARRSQSCLHTPIRTPVSLHRNLLFAEVLRRPVESAQYSVPDDSVVCVSASVIACRDGARWLARCCEVTKMSAAMFTSGKLFRGANAFAVLPAIALLLCASLLAALEGPSKPFLEKNSFLLSSAGFRVKLANDPAGLKAM